MESYVVRIYRRDAGCTDTIIGLVELVDVGEERSFASFEELRAILNYRPEQGTREGSREIGEIHGK